MRKIIPIVFVFAFVATGCIFKKLEASDAPQPDAGTDAGSDGTDTAPDCAAPEQACGVSCVDTSASDEHCGRCGNSCEASADGLLTVCSESMCQPTDDCADTFVDLDGDVSNGCECQITDPLDPPGDGVDANCDGLDGDRSAALFVKAGATGDGLTPDTPKGSLSEVLSDAAADDSITQVLVAEGTYTPVSLISDVTIAGGFSGTFKDYDPSSHKTVLERSTDASGAGDLKTLEADNVENTTVISMRIVAADAKDAGASTVAVYARDSTFELRALTIAGGQAAPGADREDVAGQVSCTPHEGGDGAQPDEFNPCDRPQEANASSGDSGAPRGSGVLGGDGGAHECIPNVAAPACSGALDGGNADDGARGADGDNGAPPSDRVGLIENGFWAPASSTKPTAGDKGTGGGGGGAGGNCGTDSTYLEGGKGGDGGDGGCGGKAGENGQAGGASILVLSVGSEITLTDVTGIPGKGGDGGAGSAGGEGETSDDLLGNAGATASGGNGGDGGNGGFGGNGGDGAGGCGGPAFGVAHNDASTIHGAIDTSGQTFDPGQAGDGANAAPGGCAGVAASKQRFN